MTVYICRARAASTHRRRCPAAAAGPAARSARGTRGPLSCKAGQRVVSSRRAGGGCSSAGRPAAGQTSEPLRRGQEQGRCMVLVRRSEAGQEAGEREENRALCVYLLSCQVSRWSAAEGRRRESRAWARTEQTGQGGQRTQQLVSRSEAGGGGGCSSAEALFSPPSARKSICLCLCLCRRGQEQGRGVVLWQSSSACVAGAHAPAKPVCGRLLVQWCYAHISDCLRTGQTQRIWQSPPMRHPELKLNTPPKGLLHEPVS